MRQIVQKQSPRSKVVAIIQARMGSCRFPGKALKPIGGVSVLHHVVHRLRQVRKVELVTVATTLHDLDDAIVAECSDLNVPCFRGPDQDVLKRYLLAADHYGAGVVVRATADNPAIDPGSVQRALEALQADRLDYVCETGLPKGCCGEVFTYEALKRSARNMFLPQYRERVTLAMKEYDWLFHGGFPKAPESLQFPEVNLNIDTEEEYRFVRSAMELCTQGALSATLKEILEGILGAQRHGARYSEGDSCYMPGRMAP